MWCSCRPTVAPPCVFFLDVIELSKSSEHLNLTATATVVASLGLHCMMLLIGLCSTKCDNTQNFSHIWKCTSVRGKRWHDLSETVTKDLKSSLHSHHIFQGNIKIPPKRVQRTVSWIRPVPEILMEIVICRLMSQVSWVVNKQRSAQRL